MTRPRVLIADDKPNMLKLLSKVLSEHFDVTTARDGQHAIELARSGQFDVVLTDIRMPRADGFSVLSALKREHPEVEVVLMTAYGSVPKAVEAIKAGAHDYLTKPFEPATAVRVVQNAVDRKRLRAETRDLRAAVGVASRFEGLVGRSGVMQAVFAAIERAASSGASVLITGEPGTGKSLVASALHTRSRRHGPFVVARVPSAELPAGPSGLTRHQIESLLASAKGGTLYLEEIADWTPIVQADLLEALRQLHASRAGAEAPGVGIVASTALDVPLAVSEGRLSEELIESLCTFRIHLPPLAARPEDVPILAGHFLERYRERHRTPAVGFTADALDAMFRHAWPGNVRELEQTVARAVAVVDGPHVPLEALSPEVQSNVGAFTMEGILSLSYRDAVDHARDQASRDYLIALMREFGGNVTHAADFAGVERESLHRLLRRYRIQPNAFRFHSENPADDPEEG